MSTIHFEAKLFEINSWIILRLPEDASEKLPSRGMTMVSGTINGVPFKTLLEPDGRYAPGQKPSHWFRPDKTLLDDASAKVGDTVQVSLEPTKDWIEPEVPEDVKKALATSPKAEALWKEITPLARLGLDSLDTRCQNTGDPPKAHRRCARQTQQRNETPLLF